MSKKINLSSLMCAVTICILFTLNCAGFGANKQLNSGIPGTVKWQFKTGAAINFSNPLIGPDGTIYAGSNDSYLYAVNPDGNLKWKLKTDSSVTSSPAICSDGKTVYIANDRGHIYAVNAADGSQKWEFTKTTGCIFKSSPTIGRDGTVYIGSDDKNLYSINSDGSLKWTFSANGQIESTPVIGSDGTIYTATYNTDKNQGTVYAITPDGSQKWQFNVTGAFTPSFVTGKDNTVYVAFMDTYSAQKNGHLYALNSNGQLKWKCDSGIISLSTSPAIGKDGNIYLGGTTNDGQVNLYSINPVDGTKKIYATIELGTDEDQGVLTASPVIGNNGTIYVEAAYRVKDGFTYHTQSKLYALNNSGIILWSTVVDQSEIAGINSTPAISPDENTIYVGSLDNNLYAINC